MELSNAEWAFGVIKNDILSKSCGRVETLAILNEKKKLLRILDKTEAEKLFQPKGCVFGPSLFNEYKDLRPGDTVIFQYENNDQIKTENHDHLMIKRNTLEKHGIKLYEIKDLNVLEEYFLDLEKLYLYFEEINLKPESRFYIHINRSIIGELLLDNGKIRPEKGKNSKLWKIEECSVISYYDDRYLFELPNATYEHIDCMDYKQLNEWLRQKLMTLDKDYVKKLDENTKWREDLPKMIKNSNAETKALDFIRLNRFFKISNEIELTKMQIVSLAEYSTRLDEICKQSIEKLKDEFIQDFQHEFEEQKNLLIQRNTDLNQKILNLENEIKCRTKELKELEKRKNDQSELLKHIEKNKERLLKDFQLFQPFLNPYPHNPQNFSSKLSPTDQFEISTLSEQIVDTKSTAVPYFIEKIEPQGTSIESEEAFENRIMYYLSKYEIKIGYTKRLLKTFAACSCFFIPDPRFAVAFAEAVGNTNYLIQQVEPDWLHFKNFWENGLGEIWKLSFEEPDKLHIVILEDINLASPECWGRPLFDVLSGVRKRIPYGRSEWNSGWPKNLKIAATKLPADNPCIGLPIYEQTFKNWGSITPKESFNSDSPYSDNLISGYIKPNKLDDWKPEDFEIQSYFEKKEYTDIE